jgi:hypothetical protein
MKKTIYVQGVANEVDVDDEPPRRPRGNPSWVKGGASPNPGGRPRLSQTATGALLAKTTPEDRADMLLQLALNGESEQVRLAAAQEIWNRCEGPVTRKVDATITPGSRPQFDFSRLPLEARRQLLDQLRACRIEQPSDGGELDALPELAGHDET